MSAAERLRYFPPLLSVTFPRKYTVEEYLAIADASEEKLEYIKGYIVPKFSNKASNEAGGTHTHALISTNVTLALGIALKGKPCYVIGSDLKIKADANLRFPDAMVICNEPKFEENNTNILTNPSVLVEVISPESSKRDYGKKRLEYFTIVSLLYYIIIEQDNPFVSVYTKNKDGSFLLMDYKFDTPIIHLVLLNIQIDLNDIYDRVFFD